MSPTLDPAVAAEFATAAGTGGWTTDTAAIAPHLVDWRGQVTGAAALLLRPATTAQVSAIVRIAARHRVALVPQGGNTGLVGGAIPDIGGAAVLISLARLDRIRSVDAAGLTLTVEAGAILSNVHDAALAAGCVFPLSLASKGSATIGGLVSTNAGGVQVVQHGTMRSLVAGLEAVLPDGSVLDQITGLAKDNSGYDIKQLLIGAEGTLGIVTAIALKLVPAPAHRAVAWAGVEDPHAALALLGRLRRAAPVESFELIPDKGLQMVLRYLPHNRAPLRGAHAWHVLIELAGDPSLDATLETELGQAVEAGEVDDAVVAQSGAQAAALWRIREELPEAERRDGAALHHDIAVAVSAMPGFTIAAGTTVEAAFPGARVLAFGHLGDGNLHFNVCPPLDEDGREWVGRHGTAVTMLVYDLVTAAGGSISAEHGIGSVKRAELARLGNPAKLAAMRAIKAALDPLGIMNPGKVI